MSTISVKVPIPFKVKFSVKNTNDKVDPDIVQGESNHISSTFKNLFLSGLSSRNGNISYHERYHLRSMQISVKANINDKVADHMLNLIDSKLKRLSGL